MHECKADAIGEGPFFVVVLLKQLRGCVEPLGVNPFKPEKFAFESGLEEIGGGSVAVPDEQKGCSFINYIVGGQKVALFAR